MPGSITANCVGWKEAIIVCLSVVIYLVMRGSTNFSADEYSELKRQLKFLNRPAVKSIETKYGDIFDCVDINNQPALDHPLLKNHTIQMQPSFLPQPTEEKDLSATADHPDVTLGDGGCPEGTVPIRRTRMADLLRAKTLPKYERKNMNSADSGRHHYARLMTKKGGEYYGTEAVFNLWVPRVELKDQFSLAQFWIVSGEQQQLNTIEAGWHVFPDLYGDKGLVPRLFVFWTANNYNGTGCYNLRCPGFVQVSRVVAPGMQQWPPSTYDGAQRGFLLLASRDPETGNWWLTWIGSEHINVGYWPNSLFTPSGLGAKATALAWGGEVYTKPDAIFKPEMGSGRFADKGYGRAAYVRKISAVNSNNTFVPIPNDAYTHADVPNCYNISDKGTSGDPQWGRHFYFGGTCNCYERA